MRGNLAEMFGSVDVAVVTVTERKSWEMQLHKFAISIFVT